MTNISEDTNKSKGSEPKKRKPRKKPSKPEEESKEGDANDDGGATKGKGGKRRRKSTTDSAAEPKAKKARSGPRCKPERAREVFNQMLHEMVMSYKIGRTEVQVETLVEAVGLSNRKSDAFVAARKLLHDCGWVEIRRGNRSYRYALTERGVQELVVAAADGT